MRKAIKVCASLVLFAVGILAPLYLQFAEFGWRGIAVQFISLVALVACVGLGVLIRLRA